jgi:hypothetical protein
MYCLLADAIILYDDIARITPSDQKITLDVLKNDNLGSVNPADVRITIIAPGPAAGSAVVVPAAAPSSSSSRQQAVQFAIGSAPLQPGQSLTFYYSVVVGGQAAPAPAAVTIIGAGKRLPQLLLFLSCVTKALRMQTSWICPASSLSTASNHHPPKKSTASVELPVRYQSPMKPA